MSRGKLLSIIQRVSRHIHGAFYSVDVGTTANVGLLQPSMSYVLNCTQITEKGLVKLSGICTCAAFHRADGAKPR